MMKEAIDLQAQMLTVRINNIINWIRENPNTDPNYYEIMDCYVDYATLVSAANDYYATNGYPSFYGGVSTRHQIVEFDPVIRTLHNSMKELLKLREMLSSFRNEEEVNEFMDAFYFRASGGEYLVPQNPILAQIKKEILCKSMSISFYIRQEKRKDPNYKYDNMSEFMLLKEQYRIYQTIPGGPQFGSQVEALLEKKKKNYKYSGVGVYGGTAKQKELWRHY